MRVEQLAEGRHGAGEELFVIQNDAPGEGEMDFVNRVGGPLADALGTLGERRVLSHVYGRSHSGKGRPLLAVGSNQMESASHSRNHG